MSDHCSAFREHNDASTFIIFIIIKIINLQQPELTISIPANSQEVLLAWKPNQFVSDQKSSELMWWKNYNIVLLYKHQHTKQP